MRITVNTYTIETKLIRDAVCRVVDHARSGPRSCASVQCGGTTTAPRRRARRQDVVHDAETLCTAPRRRARRRDVVHGAETSCCVFAGSEVCAALKGLLRALSTRWQKMARTRLEYFCKKIFLCIYIIKFDLHGLGVAYKNFRTIIICF